MSKIIAVSNQKGGVGKTTTVINLSVYLAQKGKRVLIVDIDPQGNAGSGLDIDKKLIESKNIYNILTQADAPADMIIQTEYQNLSIICSNQDLSGAAIEIVAVNEREYILKKALDLIKHQFDYIFIDTPPSLGLLTINALTTSDSVFIPIQCEFYALEGISQLVQTIRLIKEKLNLDLYIEGVCLTMYDSRTNLSKEVAENIKTYFKERAYESIIPRNVKISEAPSHGKAIFNYASDSIGAIAYSKVGEEFLRKNEV